MAFRLTATLATIAIIGALAPCGGARADLSANAGQAVIYGHHHINVSDLAGHRRFWVETLGGKPVDFGDLHVVSFSNVLVFLREQAPAGGTKGTTVNHIGFTVPDLRATLDTLAAAGYPDVTRAEVPASYEVVDGIAYNAVQKASLAFVMAPDQVKIEFIEDTTQSSSPRLHHIHFATEDIAAMKNWYVKTLGAVPGKRGNFEAADLPGVNLTFSGSDMPLAATRNRSLDHIGFEVDGLEALCRRLENQGMVFDVPYTEVASLGISLAFLTDPFGTYIELTEGLDDY